ncbi:hypothetical protein AB5J52_01460 [Streptomyces sp. R39]|uniref:ATP-binding protein n=1 Tax=Streptomyces sp. R39 TaxID=3238631 RepID=A0AB39QEY7_9ACTN
MIAELTLTLDNAFWRGTGHCVRLIIADTVGADDAQHSPLQGDGQPADVLPTGRGFG